VDSLLDEHAKKTADESVDIDGNSTSQIGVLA
jgi:hypothetical protein